MGDREWYKIRRISEGFIEGDEEPFRNIQDPKYTFQYICEAGFYQLKEKYVEIALLASKEIELQKAVSVLELFWKEARLNVEAYKNQQDSYILKGNQEMINQ